MSTHELAQARIDLAAVLRWSARLGYQQGVCNHFSVMAPESEDVFLVNPEGLFWSEVTASSLLLCRLDGTIVEGTGTVEKSAFSLHAPIHRHNPRARAVLHTHSPYATALCLIDGAQVEPVFLAGLQFFGKIAYDEDCHGAAFDTAEGDREAGILGDNNVLMMRNHGPIVVGPTVASAFDRLYYLEQTCERQLLAMAAQRPLRAVQASHAQALADMVPAFDAYAEKHLAAIKRVLDREAPEYSAVPSPTSLIHGRALTHIAHPRRSARRAAQSFRGKIRSREAEALQIVRQRPSPQQRRTRAR